MERAKVGQWALLAVLAFGTGVLWNGLENDRSRTTGAGESWPSLEVPGEVPFVRLGLMALDAVDLNSRSRDLFEFYEPPKAPVKIVPDPIVLTHVDPPSFDAGGRSRPVVVPAAPEPEFVYLGLLGPREDKIGVFERGKDLVLARIGDAVDDGFELLEFRYEAVVLRRLGGKYRGDTTTLRKHSG